MWKTILLVLPVLIPSWRFFKAIEPSPRVQWAVSSPDSDLQEDWQEFRPRPQSVSPSQMTLRLFWNPRWNETLFLVSCAERMQQAPTDYGLNEIRQRIASEIQAAPIGAANPWFRFRLVFVQRSSAGLSQSVVFTSEAFPTAVGRGR